MGVAPARYVCDALANAALLAAHPRFVARSSNGQYFRALADGTLDMTIAGVREVYSFEHLRSWKRRLLLRDGEFLYAFGPPGLLVRARAYTTPGVTVGNGQQLTGLWLGRSSANGANIAAGTTAQLEPGKDVAIPCYGGLVAGTQWAYRTDPLALLCTTSPAAGLNAANEFVEFEGWFAEQPDLDVALGEAAFRSAGVERDPFEAYFPSYDVPPVAAGGTLTIELVIPDMGVSDFIETVRIVGGFAGLELRRTEPLAGLARLTIVKPTNATIDRQAADLGISFVRPISGG